MSQLTKISDDRSSEPLSSDPHAKATSFKKHWITRYGLAVLLFGATLGLSLLLTYFNTKINLTIPIVFALVATAWWGGRGPGFLISVLFQTTTIIYATIPPDSTVAKTVFGWFSIFSLYIFLVLVISGLRKVQTNLREQRDLLETTLSSIGDAVITTDTAGRIAFMNPAAQQLTDWRIPDAKGRLLSEVFDVVNETGDVKPSPVDQVLKTGTLVGQTNQTMLISRSGKKVPIYDRAAPIRDGDEVKGAVLVFSDISERKRAERAIRESEIMHCIVEAQEGERHRIARDLHDHLGQRMTALRLKIGLLSDECPADSELNKSIAEVQRAASAIDRDLDFLSWELRPTELENFGLINALSSFVREWSRQYGIAADFHTNIAEIDHSENRLPQTVETNLYRIVQEALNNIVKHADARNVSVLLHLRDDVILIIEDDGRGFARESKSGRLLKPGGLGLVGMRERASLLKGTLDIDSESGTGTSIRARIPIS